MNPKQLLELKEKIEKKKREKDRAIGGIERILSEIKKKYGVDSESDIVSLVKDNEKKLETLKEEVEKEEKRLIKKWPDLFFSVEE